MSQDRYIDIPKEVRNVYKMMGRPSPLFRAKGLEDHLDTPAKIYYKREDYSPTGSHKLNTAIAQAYYAKKDGAERLTTKLVQDNGVLPYHWPVHWLVLTALFTWLRFLSD